MIAQYTMLLLALRAAQFVHHVSVLSLEDITRGKGNFIQHARTQLNNRACARRMAEQRGIHDVIFHATARPFVPGCALDLIVPVLMLPRACAVHALSPRHAGRGRDPVSGDGETLGLQCNHDDVHDTESGAGL